MDQSSDDAEIVYKQNVVESSSIPRLSLMLYGRMIQILKALARASDLSIKKKGLMQVHQMLSHLVQVYGQSNDPAYTRLMASHEALTQQISRLFQAPQTADIQAMIKQVKDFRQAWTEPPGINNRKAREYPGLNVRPFND